MGVISPTRALEVQQYLDRVFEFEKNITTAEVIIRSDTDAGKDQMHIYILSPKIAQMIGRKGWIVKILADVIHAKYSVYPNIHMKQEERRYKNADKSDMKSNHTIQTGGSEYDI
jgi:ribosomal protein S3